METYLSYDKIWSVFIKLAARKGYTIPDKDELGCRNSAGEYIKLGKIIGHQVTMIENGVKTTQPFSVLEEWTKRNETLHSIRKRNVDVGSSNP